MTYEKLPYDQNIPEDIERYAKELEGKTFLEILEDNYEDPKALDESISTYNNVHRKGGLGNLLEKEYFFYDINSDSNPDFEEAGVELKVTPYEITKGGKYRAGERLVIGMIPNAEPVEEDFYKSHLFEKMQLMLLIFYLREQGKERVNHRIDYVQLFSILSESCKEDLLIIKSDYNKIISKIRAGKAHEISEGDTEYLGACTKGPNAAKSMQPQYYNPNVPAKRRAFSLKQCYMTYVLNHYILKNIETYDSAFTFDELEGQDLEHKVLERIEKYYGKTEESIYNKFDISPTTKQKNNIAICRMLGVKTDRIAEFEKAEIKIKTVRVKQNGKPRESMSFPAIVIKEFIGEEFEDSYVYNYFSEKRFLFVVFRENENNEYELTGAKFWNMPIVELENQGYKEWKRYQDKFIEGVTFNVTRSKNTNKIIVKNDLPTARETEIFHMRPHAQKSGYIINGVKYGSGSDSDMDELPNGDKMTKQCFWLNNDYVADIIKDVK